MASTLFKKLAEERASVNEVVFFDRICLKLQHKFEQELKVKVTFFHDIIAKFEHLERPSHEDVNLDTHLTYSFTSGTTGLPKGVICTHRNAISQLLAMPNFIDYSS